jgi:hypothetical protein
MRFRLIWYVTNSEDKLDADDKLEWLGNRKSIFRLYWILKDINKKHVEVYNLEGDKQIMNNGLNGLNDYNS